MACLGLACGVRRRCDLLSLCEFRLASLMYVCMYFPKGVFSGDRGWLFGLELQAASCRWR